MDDWWIALIATLAALVSAATASYTVYVQMRTNPTVYLVLVSAYVDMDDLDAGVPVWYFRVVNIGTAPARNVQWEAPLMMRNHSGPVLASDLLHPGEGFDGIGELLDANDMGSFPWDLTVKWREAPRFEKQRLKVFEGSPDGAKQHGGGY